MKQTIILRLEPEVTERNVLNVTLETFKLGCEFVSEMIASNQASPDLDPSHLIYEMAQKFDLPSSLSEVCIREVVDWHDKHFPMRDGVRRKIRKPSYKLGDCIPYNSDNMSFENVSAVSLLTKSCTIQLPFRVEGYQPADRREVGEAELSLRGAWPKQNYILLYTVDLPSNPPGRHLF